MPPRKYHQRAKGSAGEQWNINRPNFTGTIGWDEGLKVPGFRFDGSGKSFQTASVNDTFGWSKDSELRNNSSKSSARKCASAMIAKIPEVLSRHIARVYHPRGGALTERTDRF